MRLFKSTRTVEISWRDYRALRKGGWLSTVSAGLSIVVGILCFLPAVPAFLSQQDWLNDWMSADSLRWFCAVVGLCSAGAGVSRLRLRLLLFRSRQLIAHDDLCEKLAVDEETLDAAMRQRSIQPHLILNGRRFYKRSDFGDMPLLLRPSQAPPVLGGMLLRPLQGNDESQPEHLLRPAVGETVDAVVCKSSSTLSQ